MNPLKAINAVTKAITASKESGKSDVKVLGDLLFSPMLGPEAILQPLVEHMGETGEAIVMLPPRKLPDGSGRAMVQFYRIPDGGFSNPKAWEEIQDLRRLVPADGKLS